MALHPYSYALTILIVAAHVIGCGADAPPGNDRNGMLGSPIDQGGGAGTMAPGTPGIPGMASSVTGDDPFGNTNAAPTELPDLGIAPGEECKSPTVVFVIDGSGSMCEVFGGSTRWGELRAALLNPQGGLIYRLESQGSFGMLLYDGSVDLALTGMAATGTPAPACAGAGAFMRGMGECPQLIEVPPALFNANAIDTAFPQAELGGSTPTDKAMNHVVDQLVADSAGIPPDMNDRFIILATDGQPNDVCVGGLGGDGLAQQQAVLTAVDRGAAAGITTFVISLAGGDPVLEAHLAEVAVRGDPWNPAAVTYSPADPDSLVSTLLTLLGTAFGCNLE